MSQGKIVLIQRGPENGDSCSYVQKVLNAEEEGAAAVVIFNDDRSRGLNAAMPLPHGFDDEMPTIPAFFISVRSRLGWPNPSAIPTAR